VSHAIAENRTELDLEIAPIAELAGILEELNEKNVLESYHDAQTAMEIALQMFANGNLTIEQRALAESLTLQICLKINNLVDDLEFVPKDLDDLRYALADTYFANFSLFQALPDAWALGQLFPVVPIHRLNERPSRFGILGDMTCDSDGKLDCFIGGNGTSRWLPLHTYENQPYYIGVFLMGAYQESLSDDHNLMGKFHIVSIDEHEPYENSTYVYGSTLREVLEHVHHDWPDMSRDFSSSVERAIREDLVSPELGAEIFTFFEQMSESYTYLTDTVGEAVGQSTPRQ
jgi:arginine decarboxylase